VNDYLAGLGLKDRVDNTGAAFKDAEREVTGRIEKLLSNQGDRTVDDFWKQLGKIMWNDCGMARSRESLTRALQLIPALREEFHQRVRVLPGSGAEVNQELEKAGRVADFLELGELMCLDALHREESCGGHFRTEYQTPDGEAQRNDAEFAYVAAWEWKGQGQKQALNKEPLVYENIQLAVRSYK
jgi:succinate dehydrogenase / fumarate reductase flavoprotein subunit